MEFSDDFFFPTNSSQTIGPKGHNFTGYNEDHYGMVIRKLG